MVSRPREGLVVRRCFRFRALPLPLLQPLPRVGVNRGPPLPHEPKFCPRNPKLSNSLEGQLTVGGTGAAYGDEKIISTRLINSAANSK